MWQEIYTWIEQYAGVSYDFSEDFEAMYDELIFIDTFDWYNRFNNIKDKLIDINKTIDTYGDDLPDDFPNKIDIKRMFNESIFAQMCRIVNIVKTQLNFELTDITSFESLDMQALALSKLVSFLKENTMDQIIKHHLFEKYEEDNENIFTETFDLRESDLSSIRFTIDDIRTIYYESLEEDS